MARVNAIALRSAAREAILAAGARGFVRFLPPGGALLATDANRRCRDEGERAALHAALEGAGFALAEQDGLLALTPSGALLEEIGYGGGVQTDWTSPQHAVQALGLRWYNKERRPLTDDGRQLICEALRLSWQRPEQVQDGIDELRARGALMQRRSDISGMHEAGAILLEWCTESEGGNGDEA